MMVRHNPLVIWDVVDGEMTLCHTDSGEIFELTETGALIWRACDRSSLETIVESLRKTYCDEDPEKLSKDACGFIRVLEQAGLLEVEHGLSQA